MRLELNSKWALPGELKTCINWCVIGAFMQATKHTVVTQENRPTRNSDKLCRPYASQRAYVYWCFMDFVDVRKFNGSDIADEKCCRCRNWSRFPNTCWHEHLLWNHFEISWAYVHRYFVKFWKTLFHNAWYRCRSKTDGIVVWRSLRKFYFFLQWLYSNFNQKYQFH